MSKKGKMDPEELKILEERDMYSAKVWALQAKIGKIKSNGTRKKIQ